MSKVWLVVIIIIILGVAGFFYMKSSNSMPSVPVPAPMPTAIIPPSDTLTLNFMLDEQNQSSESGTAVLMEKDGKTVVTLSMTGGPVDVPQPAHIHTGSCPDVGAVVYPLTNVVNGKSETTLDVTFAKLASQQPLGLNVHKSTPLIKDYISCGNLIIPAAFASMSPAASSMVAPASTTGQTNTTY